MVFSAFFYFIILRLARHRCSYRVRRKLTRLPAHTQHTKTTPHTHNKYKCIFLFPLKIKICLRCLMVVCVGSMIYTQPRLFFFSPCKSGGGKKSFAMFFLLKEGCAERGEGGGKVGKISAYSPL